MSREALFTEIRDYIGKREMWPSGVRESGDSELLNQLFLELYELHKTDNPLYRHYLRKINFSKEVVTWTDIPAMPVQFFKSRGVGRVGLTSLEPSTREWLSSGTLGTRSVTSLTERGLSLYNLVISKASDELDHLWSERGLRYLPLIPTSSEWPNSSLAYMFSRMFWDRHERVWREKYLRLIGQGPEFEFFPKALVNILQGVEGRSPVLLYGTTWALARLLREMERVGVQLPSLEGTAIHTGGYKGLEEPMTEHELSGLLSRCLPSVTEVTEYGMSELSSQMWRIGHSRDKLYRIPAWVRIRFGGQIFGPTEDTLVFQNSGRTMAIYDLASAETMPFLLTQDQGIHIDDHNQFLPLGRMPQAEAKGCSITASQLGGTT